MLKLCDIYYIEFKHTQVYTLPVIRGLLEVIHACRITHDLCITRRNTSFNYVLLVDSVRSLIIIVDPDQYN